MKIPYTTDDIRRLAAPIAERYGVNKMALFGSYAKGAPKQESDLDFVIDKGDIRGLFRFCGFVDELETAFDAHVDVLTYDALRDSLISDALQDEVVLYERQG